MELTSFDDLLIKFLDGECSPEDQLKVIAWIKEKPENYEYFLSLQETAILTKSYDENFNPDKEAAWKKVLSEIERNESAKFKKANKGRIYYRAAAVIFIAFSLYMVYNLFTGFGKKDYVELANLDQNLQKIDLPDGTKVWLSKSGKIKYPVNFSGQSRDVSLTGEAFFEVAKDPAKPFIVTGNRTIVKVLGTSFVYRTYDEEDEDKLIVNTGKVSFTEKENNNNSIPVDAGFSADFHKSTRVIDKAERNNKSYFAQRTGRLIFENERFENIISSVAKYYDRGYYFNDNKLRDIRITIAFNNQPIEEAIKLLETVMDRKITDSSQTIVVY